MNVSTPTLVLLPGTLCDMRVWQPVAERLDPQWRKQFVDFGALDCVEAMAERALSVTTGLLLPTGVSMGGMVALEMWRLAPERIAGLALFDTNPRADTEAKRRARKQQLDQARLAGDNGLQAVVRSHLLPSYFPRAVSPVVEATVLAMAADAGLTTFVKQSAALASRIDYWPLLSCIQKPVLVACGEFDTLCPPAQHRQMAAQLAQAQFRLIGEAGHLAPLEQPSQTAAILQEWIASIGGRFQAQAAEDARV
ncbi:MAG: alpha/beta fold hydrolase [Burkholderiales bacterium]